MKAILNKNTTGAWLFLFAAFIILILTPLFQQGTFIDGMLYKAVAYNYSQGTGFWQMKFTDTSMQTFCEQPPLYFSFLGLFYKITNSHYIADRMFTLLLFIAFAFVSYRVIKSLSINQKGYFALFIFFILSIPVFCWSYVNQVIEPLVCVFTSLGILFFIQFIKTNKSGYIIYFALNLLLLFLSKGFQSCFIIGLPVIYWLKDKLSFAHFKFSILSILLLTLSLVSLLYFFSPAKNWFICYYNTRLLLTIQNVGNTTDSHLEIIVRFFTELIIPVLGIFALGIYLRFKKYPIKFVWQNFAANKLASALLLTSLLGSLPYAVSLVQRGFYLLPAFVCFIFAIVLGLRKYWMIVFYKINMILKTKSLTIALPVILLTSVIYSVINISGYKRDETLLNDLELIKPYLKNEKEVQIEPFLWNYFSLHAYIYMWGHTSLSLNKNDAHYFLIQKNASPSLKEGSYSKINLPTRELDIYLLK